MFFDNDLDESEANLPQFNLERLARIAAQQMIQHVMEMEVSEFLEREKYEKTPLQDFRGYRNGHHKQRTISTSFGSLEVTRSASLGHAAKVSINLSEEIKTTLGGFGLNMLQICSRKVWQREMREPALRFLVGESAPLSPSSISRFNIKEEYESLAKRDLSDLKIVYVRADGIHLKAGIAENVQKRCANWPSPPR